jgi:Fe2+ transport system protein B
MVAVGFITIIVYIVLMALIALVLPTILLSLYVIWMFTNNGDGGALNIKQRLTLNLMTIISVLYYLLDFHYGWISFQILGGTMSKETLDTVATFNLTIGILSVGLFFFGHELYRLAERPLIRVLFFLSILYFGVKMVQPISNSLIHYTITQSTDMFDMGVREENYVNPYDKTDEERQQEIDERDVREREREERLRQFDNEWANKAR